MANVMKIVRRFYGSHAVSIDLTAKENIYADCVGMPEEALVHGCLISRIYCRESDSSEWDLTGLSAFRSTPNGTSTRRQLFYGNILGERLSLGASTQLGFSQCRVCTPLELTPGEDLYLRIYAFPSGKKPVTARLYIEYSYVIEEPTTP